MRLLVTTPMSVVLDVDDVQHVRAEDGTGAFGILPGHSNFITVLDVSVITWRDKKDAEHHIATRGGVLAVRGGDLVEVATREAVGEDTLRKLGQAVVDRLREEKGAEGESRLLGARLEAAAISQIQRYLNSSRRLGPREALSSLGTSSAANTDGNQGM